ncbi:MAG: hypothetical protein CL928_04340 [Deltaproteobacteria bacterium]|nr:hypothetical protein [Deltaproteobacteria bacterium]
MPRFPLLRLLTYLLFLSVVVVAITPVAYGGSEDEEPVDADEDGFSEDEDCDDDDASVNPDAEEVCDDAIDNDCDGVEWVVGQDLDGDGYTPANSGCEGTDCDDTDASLNQDDADEDDVTSCNGDCDDNEPLAGPGEDEICGDTIDNDCSGVADDLDEDLDSYIAPECGGDDCDDSEATVNPAMTEGSATCADGVDNDCDLLADAEDEDCLEEPEVDAGIDQNERYVGGTVLIALDGSGTTDFNETDVLSYTWTLETDVSAMDGVTVELITDSASPYAYLRFQAEPTSAESEWVFDFSLSVSDGLHSTDPTLPEAQVTARVFRPSNYIEPGCSLGQGSRLGGVPACLLLAGLALVGLRRRRATHG